MKKILVFVFCIFILPFYLSANAYGAEADDLEPWEITIENAETLLSDGSVEDAYREALTAINVYLQQTEFDAESFITMIKRVIHIAKSFGGKEAERFVLQAVIPIAEQAPANQASAQIDLWLMMADIRTEQGERVNALKNVLDVSKKIYSPTDEKIIDVWIRVLFIDFNNTINSQQNEEVANELLGYIVGNFPNTDLLQYTIDIANIYYLFYQKPIPRSRIKNWSEAEVLTLDLLEKLEGYGGEADAIRYAAYVVQAKAYLNEGHEEKLGEIISKISDLKMSGVWNYKPILKEPPRYPRQAQERALSGSVLISSCIDEYGNTYDVEVAFSSSDYFNRPSIWAVRKFKYIPTFIDGVAVAECGIHNEIVYEMEP